MKRNRPRRSRRATGMFFAAINRMSFNEWFDVRKSYWARCDYYNKHRFQRMLKTMKGE